MTSRSPSILYVLGRGRSGSTIFANVLGAHAGYFSAGEVRYLWDPVVRTDGACACGQPVSACEVWSRVLDRLTDVNVDEAAAWQREVVRERNLLRLLRYRRGGSWPVLERYVQLMGRVYEALSDVTGSPVIVDSSKRPSYAAVVRLIEGHEFYCVQLVRDPRASAYSWAHRRHRSVFGSDHEVKRRGAFDSTLRWTILNLEAELLGRRLWKDHMMQLRYEDFVASPQEIVSNVIAFVGHAPPSSPFRDTRTVELPTNHTVAGNPSRYAAGELVLRDSAEWRDRQRARDRRVATAVASPFLKRYGYRARVADDR